MEQPPVRPDVLQWIQDRLTSDEREAYPTPGDMFYASSHTSTSDLRHDHRWDDIFTRTLVFKRYFKILKRNPTVVEMVEAMQECGMSSHFLETLPEAVLVPLQDAISLCQPHPPSTWSNELLELVKRSDIGLILDPGKRPKPTMSHILVRLYANFKFGMMLIAVRRPRTLQAGTTNYSAKVLKSQIMSGTTRAREPSVKPLSEHSSRMTGA